MPSPIQSLMGVTDECSGVPEKGMGIVVILVILNVTGFFTDCFTNEN
jgi:hypothetical protein